MPTLVQSVQSKEYVRIPISATEVGVAVDPTSDTIELAFTAEGVAPVSGDWKTGSWETAGSIYYARILIGPSSNALAAGDYSVWVRVTDAPEIPVRRVGRLRIV